MKVLDKIVQSTATKRFISLHQRQSTFGKSRLRLTRVEGSSSNNPIWFALGKKTPQK